MIPELEDGVLPPGIHDCTLDEIDEVFGRFQRTDHRMTLVKKLRQLISDLQFGNLAKEVIIDGSFTTAKERPEDIDLLVILPSDFVWLTDLKLFEYNSISKRMVKNMFRFDLFAANEGGSEHLKMLTLFQNVKQPEGCEYTSKTIKGVLRIIL